MYNLDRLISTLVASLIISFSFWDLSYGVTDRKNRIFLFLPIVFLEIIMRNRNIFVMSILCVTMVGYLLQYRLSTVTLFESLFVASTLNPGLIIFVLFSSILVTTESTPDFWSSWLYWRDLIHYFIESLIVNELVDTHNICNKENYISFKSPPDQTSGEYLMAFFNEIGASG
ncbi:hypothetical protein BDA99DRAFT_540479 [Phascolomyces articulosus]|uniref:Uncharacterized protein n=1 Tax=Phascolomyces articulosus TaxID=60185 RepID=A0AAD5JU26_9FUNG|nr:hypothetical protein BDA99DRAFT_540479 [Phascolomyces articulosus]